MIKKREKKKQIQVTASYWEKMNRIKEGFRKLQDKYNLKNKKEKKLHKSLIKKQDKYRPWILNWQDSWAMMKIKLMSEITN